jgi:hypothetical protein
MRKNRVVSQIRHYIYGTGKTISLDIDRTYGAALGQKPRHSCRTDAGCCASNNGFAA